MAQVGDADGLELERMFEAMFGEPPVIRDINLLRQILSDCGAPELQAAP